MYRVIIKHHPRKAQEAAFIEQWQKGSDLIQTHLGARGTKLFRYPSKPGVFFAMADWENKEVRSAAMEAIRKEHPDAEAILHGYEGYVDSHETAGEFERVAESNPPRSASTIP